MSVREVGRETALVTWAWVVAGVLTLLTVLAFGATYYGVAPWAANKEREINQNTQQYQETQVRGMRDQISKYESNDVELAVLKQDSTKNADVITSLERQQTGIVTFVRKQSNTLRPDAVPDDIRQFLSSH